MLRFSSVAKDLLIQQILESDEGQFSALMDRSFQVPAGQSYLRDFPVWKGRTPEILKMGAYDGTRLVGAACVRVADLWTRAPSQLSVGLIGGVATDENYRGRGVASKLVSLATDWAENRGAALAVLWGSEHELYSKIGFYPCGEQVRVSLSGIPSGASEVSEGWNPALFSLLQNRRSGLALSQIDSLWISAQANVRWFWSGPRENPTAYAALGRGIDLTHMVHEWGGPLSELLPLLSAVSEVDPASELLGSPSVFRQFGIQYDPASVEYLCLARVLDPSRVLQAFVPESRAVFSGENWELGVDGDRYSVSPEKLPRLIFGPAEIGDAGEVFPLPLWFWGLDAG